MINHILFFKIIQNGILLSVYLNLNNKKSPFAINSKGLNNGELSGHAFVDEKRHQPKNDFPAPPGPPRTGAGLGGIGAKPEIFRLTNRLAEYLRMYLNRDICFFFLNHLFKIPFTTPEMRSGGHD
ncbi:MAG: hypothetical protein PHQ33_06390, partial [Bacteroidales bacterium]|nr:hypothetical protein [Bacteroidales bacterium]